MKSRSLVLITAAVAILVFVVAAIFYFDEDEEPAAATVENSTLIRPHSPVLGPADARVTVVEFLDPSCETCRAFYPLVKGILERFPDVRVVVRYAAFHEGSEEAIRILEAAREQQLYEPVMEALFARQEEWAVHGAPNLDLAWSIAAAEGVDVVQARLYGQSDEVDAVLEQDAADVVAAAVQSTPTFFVNGEPLATFGMPELVALVEEKLRETE